MKKEDHGCRRVVSWKNRKSYSMVEWNLSESKIFLYYDGELRQIKLFESDSILFELKQVNYTKRFVQSNFSSMLHPFDEIIHLYLHTDTRARATTDIIKSIQVYDRCMSDVILDAIKMSKHQGSLMSCHATCKAILTLFWIHKHGISNQNPIWYAHGKLSVCAWEWVFADGISIPYAVCLCLFFFIVISESSISCNFKLNWMSFEVKESVHYCMFVAFFRHYC